MSDDLNINITVVVKDGQAIAVYQNDLQIRAIVEDYDVAFPFEPADALQQNEDGEYYTRKVI